MIQPVSMVLSAFAGILVLMHLSSTLSMSANATLDFTRAERFCFQTGPDPFEDARCFKGPANCEKAEEEFVANGGTVFGSCHHAFKPVKP